MNLLNSIKTSLLDGQYGHPGGVIGRVLGEQMVRQHVPETTWTLSLLDLKLDDQVLELGFGAGKAIELVAAQAVNGHVSGIDHSLTMVRAASRRNSQTIRTGQVSLQCADILTLPFADHQFDKVFSIQTFYFWSDPLQTIAEISRVLKPGGTLIITLSTGTTDIPDTSGLEYYQHLLEEQIIPAMHPPLFTTAYVMQGPTSRQFKTTAVIATK